MSSTKKTNGMEGKPVSGGKMTPAEEAVDIAKTILLAVAITLVFRMIAWQPFNIPSGSMRPNLLVGDFIIVSKFKYGYSRASLVFPFTRMNLDGRLFGSEPEIGDVVVFKNTRDGHKDYIKRLIGKPGDEVRMIGGALHINGVRVQREFVSNETINCPFGGSGATYQETLPNGVSYKIQECSGNNYRLDNVGPYIVPEGHYFLMGDNRDNSQDSRTPQVGMVPAEQVVGKAQRLVFSVDGAKSRIWEIWNWPGSIRYSRIFDPIE
jgi:signal peptidase I